jgi:hypothetical protein
MRAATVCVEYDDILELTLPYNRHHFEEWLIVTTPSDAATIDLANRFGCRVYTTDAFYDGGALFNKWKALEQGLDYFGREGLMCFIDADVLWPKEIPAMEYQRGILYGAQRRLWENVTPIPSETDWDKLRLGFDPEPAGYTQVFHADDLCLRSPPWHDTNWRHAGGADSFFTRQWPDSAWRWLPFWVLHLGPTWTNWAGRATIRTDGVLPPKSNERKEALRSLLERSRGPGGLPGYGLEKLP